MKLIFRIIIIIYVIGGLFASECFSQSSSQPKNIMISNVKGGKITISWVTDTEQNGYIRYGNNTSKNRTVYDERGESFTGKTHYVTIENLEANTDYHYDIVSGELSYDNNGRHYTFTTGEALLGAPSTDIAYGQVFLEKGKKAAKGAIVYISLKDNDKKATLGISQLCSSLIGDDGYWHYNLKNVRDQTSNKYFNYSQKGDSLEFKVVGPNGESSSLTVDTSACAPVLPVVLKTQSSM